MSDALDLKRWRKALVYGYGASGRAATRLLLAQGAAVTVVDARPESSFDPSDLAGESQVTWILGGEPEAVPHEVDGVVVSPGVPGDRPLLIAARRQGLPVIAEVELAFAYARGPVVAITGSNGKSTTTAMTGAMLKAAGMKVAVCGNIGVPMSESVMKAPESMFVVELSSFQLEEIASFHPRAAALLNVALDHLDRHPGLEQYLAAKRRIFLHQDERDVAVLNGDDPTVSATRCAARRRVFSLVDEPEDGCWIVGDEIVERAPGVSDRSLFRKQDVAVPGKHNLGNAMAAALLAVAMGAAPGSIVQGLRRFHGLPHRLEELATVAGVTWFDDSKGTNPAATIKSLSGFAPASVHLILGGRNKGLSFADLVPAVERWARCVYLIGEASSELEAALTGRVALERAVTMDKAVETAARRAHPGEVVVLSPACASFDQYRNFSERGDHFKQLVQDLEEVRHG